MDAGREARSATVVRRAGSKRAGPLAGWALREARDALRFGKRQGAHCVELRPGKVRFFLHQSVPGTGASGRVARGAAPARRRDATTNGRAVPPAALSQRKQRSAQRLQEFVQHKKIKMLWQRALRKVLKMCRHRRMWSVHNAWFATRSAPASAGPPAPETARMDVDGSASRAAPAEQQPGARAEGGLRAGATEFAPGLPMAEVVSAWGEAVMLAAGRWQVSWHDLANVLCERSAEVLEQKPWRPWPGEQADDRPSRSRDSGAWSPDSCYYDDSPADSD